MHHAVVLDTASGNLRTDAGGDEPCRRQDDLHRIERAAPDVHRFVSQRVANRADAADISQEALLVACAKLGSFRGDNLNGWLFAIARNLIIDYYRSQGRFTFVTVTPAEGESEPALQIPHDAVLAECAFREKLSSWLDRCTSLDLDEQVAVLQSDVYDYRDKDSAAMLRMSVPSFKLLLHGARARLKEIGGAALAPRNTSRGGSPPAPPGQMRYRLGVNCHLGASELAALQRKLVDGLKLAAFSVCLLMQGVVEMSDVVDVEMIELLFNV
jgi:RNA polymerase sigma factor (sigma-70 family)